MNENIYFVNDVAEKLDLSIPGVYKLRRVMSAAGESLGRPIGVKTGMGEVLVYSDADIEAFRAWREAHPPVTSKRQPELATYRVSETGELVLVEGASNGS
jgi:hypothetical protein